MQIPRHFIAHTTTRRVKYLYFGLQLLLRSLVLLIFTQTNTLAAIQPPPPPTSIQVADYPEPSVEDSCQEVKQLTPLCNITGYETIRPFTNSLQHHDIEKAVAELHKYAFLQTMDGFTTNVQLFLCSLFLPVCVSRNNTFSPFLLPCREECEKARNHLDRIAALHGMRWPWDCSHFKPLADGICVNLNVTSTNPSATTSNTNYPISTHQAPQNSLGLISSNGVDSPLLANGDQVDTTSSCDLGMFNCQIQGHLLCIEDKYICDGKPDCQWDGKGQTNLDEIGCDEKKCSSGQFFCDGRCLNKAQSVCNGQVECSSGIDEQNCDINLDPASVIYATVLCIAALLSIFWCISRLCIYEDEPKELHNNFITSDQGSFAEKNLTLAINNGVELLEEEQHQQEDVTAACPIYNELANSDCYIADSYQRLNIGGNSGYSSVYNGGYNYVYNELNQSSDVYSTREVPGASTPNVCYMQEPPAAPPPSPIQQSQIYSNDSIISRIPDDSTNFLRSKMSR